MAFTAKAECTFLELSELKVGDIGTVTAVLSSTKDGCIYELRLKAGEERYYVSAELRKVDESDA